MAAVTVNKFDYTVQGNKRVHYFDIDIAANEDTLDTGLGVIDYYNVLNDADDFTTATDSGGTLTFVCAGGEDGVQVVAVGS